jgi:hypothetical protein
VSFIDKQGRTIEIEVSFDRASATHNGHEIGFVETTGRREIDERGMDEPAEITAWDVNLDYRRAGIATEMIKALVDELGKLIPPAKDIGIGGMNALTGDGEAITRHCQSLGLIYGFPDERPEYDDERLDF